ncbi:hypothetical protein CCP1ISM_4600001 [Azospirillaceae bacterium]
MATPEDRLAAIIALQQQVIDACCRSGRWLALIDPAPQASPEGVLRQRRQLHGTNAAFYYPWIQVPARNGTGQGRFVPPCGHVAGAIARTDYQFGVHKAPANVELEGVIDLEFQIDNARQAGLNPEGINALRVFPRPRHPDMGSKNAEQRSAVALHQRPAVVPVGCSPARSLDDRCGVRTERTRAMGQHRSRPQHLFHRTMAERSLARHHAAGRLLCQM